MDQADDELPKLFALSDYEPVTLYQSKTPDDPDTRRIANEMQARDLDYPSKP